MSPNLLTIVILRTDPQGFKCFFARFAAIVMLRINPQGHFRVWRVILQPRVKVVCVLFHRHTHGCLRFFRGARKPTKRYIRLLIGFTMSNRKSLFFLFHFVLSISHSFVSSIILSVFAFLIN